MPHFLTDSRRLQFWLRLFLVLYAPSLYAQTLPQKRVYLDQAEIAVENSILTATANDPRPLAQMLDGLSKRFDWILSYEDPQYNSPEDLIDATVPEFLAEHPDGMHVFIPAGGSFQVLTAFDQTSPQSELRTLNSIVKAYNQSQNPGRFELQALDDGSFVILGAASAHGPKTPILNTKITLNVGPISAEEVLGQWGRELTSASGIHVDGNGGFLVNNFLIQKQITVQATNLPARDVLRQIIKATGRDYSWRFFFDPNENSYSLSLDGNSKPFQIMQLRQLSTQGYVLLVFAPSVADPRYLQEVEAVHSFGAFLQFTAVLEDPTGVTYKRPAPSLAVLAPEAASKVRNRFHVAPGEFHVVLLGMDRSVLLEDSTPLTETQLDPLVTNRR